MLWTFSAIRTIDASADNKAVKMYRGYITSKWNGFIDKDVGLVEGLSVADG